MFQKNPGLVWTFADDLGVDIHVADRVLDTVTCDVCTIIKTEGFTGIINRQAVLPLCFFSLRGFIGHLIRYQSAILYSSISRSHLSIITLDLDYRYEEEEGGVCHYHLIDLYAMYTSDNRKR